MIFTGTNTIIAHKPNLIKITLLDSLAYKLVSVGNVIVSSHGNRFCIAPSYTWRGSYILEVVCDDEGMYVWAVQRSNFNIDWHKANPWFADQNIFSAVGW